MWNSFADCIFSVDELEEAVFQILRFESKKPPYQQVIQWRGAEMAFSNNIMNSPDGSSRSNDGWKY